MTSRLEGHWAGPIRPLTSREDDVARLLARGLPTKRIAERLGIGPRTVESYIESIANALPDPDELPPRTRVMLWAAHRLWMEKRDDAA